jgi:hypothetical protein
MSVFDRWGEYVEGNIGRLIGEDMDDAFDELFYPFREKESEYLQDWILDSWRFEEIWGEFTRIWEERGGLNGMV